MAQNISSFVLGALSKVEGELAFIVCLSVIIFLTVIQLIVVLVKGEYKRIDFIRQSCLYLTVLLFQFINLIMAGGRKEYLLISVFFCLAFFSLTLCMPVRSKKLKKEERELAQFIDKQLHLQNLSTDDNKRGNISKNFVEVMETEPVKSPVLSVPIDYSHVKNVIERLNYFPLSVTDRRQVRELEGFLLEAERGGESPILKSKINDGLGALLKIMSKHGA